MALKEREPTWLLRPQARRLARAALSDGALRSRAGSRGGHPHRADPRRPDGGVLETARHPMCLGSSDGHALSSREWPDSARGLVLAELIHHSGSWPSRISKVRLNSSLLWRERPSKARSTSSDYIPGKARGTPAPAVLRAAAVLDTISRHPEAPVRASDLARRKRGP